MPAPRSAPSSPRPTGAPASRARPGRPPTALVVSAVVWAAFALLSVLAGLRGSDAATVDPATAGQINASLGEEVAASTTGPYGVMLVVATALVLGGVALLLAGRSWARQALVAVGAATVVVLALAARWETVPAMVLLVVAAAASVVPSAHRFLRRPEAGAAG